METVIRILNRYTTPRHIIIAAILFVALAMGVMPLAEAEIKRISTAPVSILDLQLGYSTATVYSILENMGEAGRRMYLLVEWTADLIYPIVYLVFLALLIARLRVLNSLNRAVFLPLLPVVIWVFDLFENIGLTILLLNYPQAMPILVAICSTLTLLKWIAFFATVGMILFFTSRWLIMRKNKITQLNSQAILNQQIRKD
jgi:hypothetical protein